MVNSNNSNNSIVKKWNGNQWQDITANLTGNVIAICVDKHDSVYVTGGIFNSNGKNYIAKWDGINHWRKLDTTGFNSAITQMCVDTFNNIYITGWFTDSILNYQGTKYIAKWNGSAWSNISTALNPFMNIVSAITTDLTGNLYIAAPYANNSNKGMISKWNGSIWSELDSPTDSLNANGLIETIICDSINNVYAAGAFTDSLSISSGHQYVAKWNGLHWSKVGGTNLLDANSEIKSLDIDRNGNLYCAGRFTDTSIAYYANNVISQSSNYVAKWDGTQWSNLGKQSANPLHDFDAVSNIGIENILHDSKGNIYVGGCNLNPSNNNYVLMQFSLSTGITETTISKNTIHVFPNPASKQITLLLSNPPIHKLEFMVYDLLGKQVLNTTIHQSSTSISIGKLNKGFYTYCIKDESENKAISLGKLVVQ